MGETNDGGFDLSLSDEEIVAHVLDENDMDAERLLTVLASALTSRHVDCELRKMGRRDAWTPGNERMNALTAALDAMFEMSGKIAKEAEARGVADAAAAGDDRPEVLRTLNQLFAHCQFAAERRANIIDDDGEERPIMRLVTD